MSSKFLVIYNLTRMFSSIVNCSDSIDDITNRLVKKINGAIAKNFSKRRISIKSDDSEEDNLFDKIRDLKDKTDNVSKAKYKDATDAIAEKANNNFNKLKEELSKIKSKGGLDAKQMWKLRKKMCPRNRDPPTAMQDKHGNLLTSDEAIKERAIEVFSERLENNTIRPHLKDLEDDTNDLCEIRLNLAKNNTTNPWTMEDLDEALKHLDNGKSRDADGLANEIFKVAGDDLKIAVLNLMILIKKGQKYPHKPSKMQHYINT